MKKPQKKLGRKPKHPWEKWFSRKTSFKLVQGVDFTCRPDVMAIQFRIKAAKEGWKYQISIQEATLTITRVARKG